MSILRISFLLSVVMASVNLVGLSQQLPDTTKAASWEPLRRILEETKKFSPYLFVAAALPGTNSSGLFYESATRRVVNRPWTHF